MGTFGSCFYGLWGRSGAGLHLGLITPHDTGNTSLCILPRALWVVSFSVWRVGAGTISSSVWPLRIAPSNPFGWFFFWPSYSVYCFIELWDFFLCSFLLSVFCPVKSSHLGLPELPAASLQLGATTKAPPGPLSLWHGLNTLSAQNTGTMIGLTSFVSLLSDSTLLHCLFSNVLKTIVSYISSHFLVISRGQVNSVPATLSWYM